MSRSVAGAPRRKRQQCTHRSITVLVHTVIVFLDGDLVSLVVWKCRVPHLFVKGGIPRSRPARDFVSYPSCHHVTGILVPGTRTSGMKHILRLYVALRPRSPCNSPGKSCG